MRRLSVTGLLFLSAALLTAQQPETPQPRKNPPLTPTTKLAAAKTAFIKNAGGNPIPYNVISSSMENWGRFTIVNRPEDADIVVEVSAPSGGGGVSVSSKTDTSPRTGFPESSSTTTRDLSSAPIKMTVFDGKSKSVIWTWSEQPKFAMRKKGQEDNLVDAAEKLFTRFHDRVEPSLVK